MRAAPAVTYTCPEQFSIALLRHARRQHAGKPHRERAAGGSRLPRRAACTSFPRRRPAIPPAESLRPARRGRAAAVPGCAGRSRPSPWLLSVAGRSAAAWRRCSASSVRSALLVSLGYFVWRLVQLARGSGCCGASGSKLIVSYVFIGFVPALLIVAFFLFGGALMFFNVSAYLFKTGVDDIVERGAHRGRGGGGRARAERAACARPATSSSASSRTARALSGACRSRWCRAEPTAEMGSRRSRSAPRPG